MASLEKTPEKSSEDGPDPLDDSGLERVITGEMINASGHAQEMDRIFSPLAVIGTAITTGNVWVALAGTITVAIFNGGPPGLLYEFIVVSIFYWCIAASIAELASAVPSSGGVYHWATITAGKYGRICGFFAGWWNFLAWIFALAATCQITGALTVSMYAVMHPEFISKRWHVFIAYVINTVVCAVISLYANSTLPKIEAVGGFFIVAGVVITIVVCAVMPHVNGQPYATNEFVWKDFLNETGYSSDGLCFVLGMLNGAFAVGTPDLTSHLAEETPNPSVNIPKAVLAQFVCGFISALLFMISIFYSLSDYSQILDTTLLFPLAEIYRQTTGTAAGSVGLLLLVLVPTFVASLGCYLTASRILWTLARDNATPYNEVFRKISPKWKNPFNAIIACAVTTLILGCIYVGSITAFNAFVGSYVILSTLSYLMAIGPHLLLNRSKIRHGYFWMKGPIGYVVNAVSCLYIMTFIVLFCFPFYLPVDAQSMNYASLITGGASIIVFTFWLWRRKDYVGPQHIDFDPRETVRASISEGK